jgi:flagellar M-ring protein FliF
VVINHRLTPGANGAAATTAPLSEDELKNVNALVREAMGFNQQRGDSVNVVNSAFSMTELGTPEVVLPLWKQPDAIAMGKEVGKAVLFLLLTMIVVFGVVRPALKAVAAVPKPAPQPSLPTESGAALPAPDEYRPASPIEQMRTLAKNDPATVANVVKAWVGEGKS